MKHQDFPKNDSIKSYTHVDYCQPPPLCSPPSGHLVLCNLIGTPQHFFKYLIHGFFNTITITVHIVWILLVYTSAFDCHYTYLMPSGRTWYHPIIQQQLMLYRTTALVTKLQDDRPATYRFLSLRFTKIIFCKLEFKGNVN